MSSLGAVGALTGRGAAAYLTDREALADNHVTAGAVTLSLDGADTVRTTLGFDIDDYGFENRDEETVCLGLDDDSNPAWVWVRACPVDSIVADELEARLVVEGETRYMGPLAGLLSLLDGGLLLSDLANLEQVPTDPGADGTVCLAVAVWAPDELADDPKTVRKVKRASPLAITLDVYAEQSRHVPTPRRPVAGETFPACGDDDGPAHAISNVSLCTSTPVDPESITYTITDPDTGADVTGTVDEPFSVTFTSPVPVQYAVVAAGDGIHRFDIGGATTFTVTSPGGTVLDVPRNFVRCACDDTGIKFDWEGAAFSTGEPLSCADRSGPNGPSRPGRPNDSTRGGDADTPEADTGDDK